MIYGCQVLEVFLLRKNLEIERRETPLIENVIERFLNGIFQNAAFCLMKMSVLK